MTHHIFEEVIIFGLSVLKFKFHILVVLLKLPHPHLILLDGLLVDLESMCKVSDCRKMTGVFFSRQLFVSFLEIFPLYRVIHSEKRYYKTSLSP